MLFNYSTDLPMVAIYGVGDLHIGSPDCNPELVKYIIDRINENDHSFCILLGDQIDNALVNSKSDVYTATMAPGTQIKAVAEILKPLVEKGKILAVLDGNHEQRTARAVGISPSEVLCGYLGVPKLYTPTTAILRITIGGRVTTIYASHGTGGGGTIGAKANGLNKRGQIIDADVIMQGHTHTPIVFRQGIIRIDDNGEQYVADRLFINCGSCLNYSGSYGDTAGFVPSSFGYPCLTLFADPNIKTKVVF